MGSDDIWQCRPYITLTGDLDADGDVDAADLRIFSENYGATLVAP
jgi:hypothetical protein